MVAGWTLFPLLNAGGKFHVSILVCQLGLDWIIACLSELSRWDFRKQHLYKRYWESFKCLEITSRSNNGAFVEISEYHNGAGRGCLCVPEGVKKLAGLSLN